MIYGMIGIEEAFGQVQKLVRGLLRAFGMNLSFYISQFDFWYVFDEVHLVGEAVEGL